MFSVSGEQPLIDIRAQTRTRLGGGAAEYTKGTFNAS
jgi:hypothetical protein